MTRLIIFTMIVKAIILALGILAWYGHGWAFGLFLFFAITSVIIDALLAILDYSTDKNMERNGQQ